MHGLWTRFQRQGESTNEFGVLVFLAYVMLETFAYLLSCDATNLCSGFCVKIVCHYRQAGKTQHALHRTTCRYAFVNTCSKLVKLVATCNNAETFLIAIDCNFLACCLVQALYNRYIWQCMCHFLAPMLFLPSECSGPSLPPPSPPMQ